MSQPRTRKILSLLPALLLTAVLVALGGLSILRKVETFQPIGFEAHRAPGAWVVDRVSSEATGLRSGDQIVLVDGGQLGAPSEVRERLVATEEVDLMVLRGGAMATFSYQRPALEFDWAYMVQVLLGLTYLLIGLFTLVRSQRQPGRLFFRWCLASAAVYLLTTPTVFDLLGKAIYVVDGWALLLLAPLTLHLFLVFPRPLTEARRLHRWLPFLYLPAAFLAAVQADQSFFAGRYISGPPSVEAAALQGRLEIYHLVAFVIASVLVLAFRLSAANEAAERRQLRWITLGVTGGYLPYILFNVVPTALAMPRPEWLELASVLPLALLPLTFAYAILRYKLWDLSIIVRDSIAYSLTLLMGVLGFALINLALRRGLPADLATARHLLSFVAGISIAGLMIPTRKGIGSSLERFQYRGRFEQRRALSGLGEQLLHERRLDPLCSKLLDQLEESLELVELNLFLTQHGALVPVRPRPELPAQLSFDDFGEDLWEREVESVAGAELSDGKPSPSQLLFIHGYRYAFPLTVRNHRVGVLLTSYKLGDIPLSSEDVDLVRQVANQAALALENAQLLEELHHRLDEVVRLESYNQGIIESSPAGIAVLGEDGRVSSCNLTFAALVGRERRAVRGRSVENLLPVELPPPGSGLKEELVTLPGGAERTLQFSVAELAALDSERQRILVVHDVSERVELERELKQKDRLASLGMLAAGVAHEVNTPITGISSYAQMLLEDTSPDDPRYAMLQKVERQTFRASRIVNSLLDFSRDRKAEVRMLDLRTVVRETFELLADRLREADVELELALPEEPIEVHGSDTELQQVFTNLGINAADAMSAREPGTARLTVTMDRSDRRARVCVADNGEGMMHEQLDKIFQPFFSTKLASGGTGLGLSISYEVVRRHGGELRVSSVPGEGSRFVVELPTGVSHHATASAGGDRLRADGSNVQHETSGGNETHGRDEVG
jgi:hypothetical protein